MSNYQDPRWQKLRLEIMQRDEWKCVACRQSHKPMNVHHIEYHGNLWNTPPSLLQTLCNECHESLGPHRLGGIYFAWIEPYGEQHLQLAAIYRHCPICGDHEIASHSGVVLFGCGHHIDPPNIGCFCFDQEITHDGFTAYIYS